MEDGLDSRKEGWDLVGKPVAQCFNTSVVLDNKGDAQADDDDDPEVQKSNDDHQHECRQ